MTSLRPVRGTHDIVGETALRHRRVIETGRAVAARYGYHEVATPIFEFTEVFARTLGETSDIVTKEMYTFEDRGGERLTLRPEYTAGIARAFISGALGQQLPIRLFASGPMFRYERPQKGRLRQFHQIDVEILGAAEPQADVEVIALGARILAELGLADHVVLELNSLGDPASRRAYRDHLVGYLDRYRDDLSEESRDRLERNPLRILDSKDPGDREILVGAPSLADSSERGLARLLRAGPGRTGRARHRVSDQSRAGARARLLHPHRVRVHDHRAWRSGRGAGRRPLRRAGRDHGRSGHARHRLGRRGRAPGHAARRGAAAAAPDRGRADRRRHDPAGAAAGRGAARRRPPRRVRACAARSASGSSAPRSSNARYAILLGEDELKAGTVVLRDLDRGEQEAVARASLLTRLLA